MPALGRLEGESPKAFLYVEKTTLLKERFFPNLFIDLADIGDRTFADEFSLERFTINQKVDADEIFDILSKTGAWKAPGEDLLPTGFLKACGPQLWKVLAQLTNASFALEHYPRCFRHADTVVLPKLGKSAKALRTPGGYRPIVLINSIGKVIETIIVRRIV